jgi:fatty-acyl-CoA synthase
MYIRDWMAQRARLSPNKLATIEAETGAMLTYRQLNERANRLANFLRERVGLQSGDRIAVLAMNRAEMLEAFFAAAKLTAILVPLNYRLTQPELEYILNDCESQVLLYESEFQSLVQQLRTQFTFRQCILFDSQTDPRIPPSAIGHPPSAISYEQALAESTADAVQVKHFDAEMPLVIIYTSGTTGHPKGALFSHRMLTWNSINTNVGWDIVSTDVTTVHAPLFHTGGLNVLTTPLLHIGATVVILRKFDATEVLEAIEKYRCTVFFGVPTMFQVMLESPRFERTDFSSIRFFISGGAPCPIPLIEAYQQRGVVFTQGYGLTEVGPNCFKLGIEDAVRKAGSIGLPSFHSQARIVDENGKDVPRGQIGELILSGLHVCSGYWRNEEATAAALRDGWFHTGDLARQDDDGYYYIVGRAKDMIISGGENIYPAEVEAVLDAHPAVASSAVIGLPDPKWGEMPVAVVITRAGHWITGDELIDFCAGKLARYKIPKRVFFVNEFPLSASGKVVKRLLKEEIQQEI